MPWESRNIDLVNSGGVMNSGGAINIGQAARVSGVSAKMIRHYESIGLLAPAMRTKANYRVYREREVAELRFIRRARDLGFTLDHIGVLLDLWRDKTRASADVKALALHHLDVLDARITELQSMRRVLSDLALCCHGDGRPECPIIDDLSGTEERVVEPPAVHAPGATLAVDRLLSRMKRPSQSARRGP